MPRIVAGTGLGNMDWLKVKDFVRLNLSTLKAHLKGTISSGDLVHRLRKL